MLLITCVMVVASLAQAEAHHLDVVSHLKQEIRAGARRQTGSSYFMVVLSYQGQARLANQSHTFSAYVRADKGGIQKWTSLAWLPRDFTDTRKMCIFENFSDAVKHELLGSNCLPVVGRNYSTEATLRMVQGTGKDLAMWGPYQISREFYDAGIVRVNELNRGKIKYMADDRKTRARSVAVNCLHAVSDVFSPISRSIASGYGFWGHNGTKKVINYFSRVGEGYIFDAVNPHQYREIKNY